MFAARWLVTPDPLLNYLFLARVFALLSLVAVALFAAQYHFGVAAVTGFWLVPAPTLPALAYALFLHSRARAAARAAEGGEAAGGKKKGD